MVGFEVLTHIYSAEELSGLLRPVVFWLYTNISEEHTASIFWADTPKRRYLPNTIEHGVTTHKINIDIVNAMAYSYRLWFKIY
jgi:hypothetical protein